jgi:hypothetical protein
MAMVMGLRMAADAIREIHELWQIDEDRVVWVGDEASSDFNHKPFGFDWWPGDFRVRVRAEGPHPEVEYPFFRLTVRTDHLTNLDIRNPRLPELLSTFNRFSSGYAMVTPLPALAVPPQQPSIQGDEDSWKVNAWLASSAYLHEAVRGWLPRLFGSLSLLQAIEGPIMAPLHADLLGAERMTSVMPGRGVSLELDGILEAGTELYAPWGAQPSRWAGSGEFPQVIERWGRTEATFGHADEGALTLETSFGDESALLRLITSEPHPRWGNGLLAIVSIPIFTNRQKVHDLAQRLNFTEGHVFNTMGAPFIGSWTAMDLGGDGVACPAYSGFIPNLLYREGLAENLILWGLGRARWARRELWPDVEDEPLPDILNRRFGAGGHGK